ncbi:MAG: hypothetical protein WBG37_19840, partial [Desulfobacterales bacterium]
RYPRNHDATRYSCQENIYLLPRQLAAGLGAVAATARNRSICPDIDKLLKRRPYNKQGAVGGVDGIGSVFTNLRG